jgi:hypothetical protein
MRCNSDSPSFQSNTSPPSSGSRSRTSLLNASVGFITGLLSDPEDVGDVPLKCWALSELHRGPYS